MEKADGEDSHIKNWCEFGCSVVEGDNMEISSCIGPGQILLQVPEKYWYGEHVDYGECGQNLGCEWCYAKQGHQHR